VVNASGTVLERYNYTPYGTPTVLDANFAADGDQISDIGNTHLYTGRERDPETGLQLNRVRYYGSHLGRWTATDPIEYLGGMNLYAYVGEMPTTRLDPFGMRSFFFGAGELCVDKDCDPDDSTKGVGCWENLTEDWDHEADDPWEAQPSPGKCAESDAVGHPNIGVLKIPDNCRCTIECTASGAYSGIWCSCTPCFGLCPMPVENPPGFPWPY
jgi:RHS repeat-associated protein